MKTRQVLRLGLIWLAIVSMGGILIKTWFLGLNNTLSSVKVLAPPSHPSIKGWNLVKSQKLAPQPPDSESGYEYYYQNINSQKILLVKMYYQPYTDGNVSRLVSLYQNIPPAKILWKIQSLPQGGHYAIFLHPENLHITACIFRQGRSTVTEQQSSIYRLHNFNFWQRIFPWMLGIRPLTDNDCWWVLLSFPVPKTASTSELYISFSTIKSFWLVWLEEFSEYWK